MVLKQLFPYVILFSVLSACSGEKSSTEVKSGSDFSSNLDDADLGKGEELYKQHCIACHGADGKLGMGGSKDLTLSSLDTAEIIYTIAKGRNGMPSFEAILGNEVNVRSVTKYALHLRK